ncbi:hypothetical protein ElyMa_004226800 [Elysia marginata]|uniref:CTNNB1 binding N-teminal domain-containing protein n=1 Tax=Elysia marginata TaxID=1093978 RepID=A0AAV4GQZ1_9GAST|nr:hypothetical protein ElyMa_004226800 [Elysia marginata]
MLLHIGGSNGYTHQVHPEHNSTIAQPALIPSHQGQYCPVIPPAVVPCQDYFDLISTPSQPAALYNPGFEAPPLSPQSFSGVYSPPVAPQQTFLHQILTGQGYKYDLGFGSSLSNNNNNNSFYSSGLSYSPNYFNSGSSCVQSSCCFGNSVLPSGFSSIQD